MESKNAKLGLQLFCIYLLLYGGFVLLNTFSPQTMELTPLAGINLAILSGFGLIVGALVLSLIYGMLCQAEDHSRAADISEESSSASSNEAHSTEDEA